MTFSRALSAQALAIAVFLLAGATRESLHYRDRGDRYEGTKLEPVSGPLVEILGAHVDLSRPPTSPSDSATIQFFLKGPETVSITVRERRELQSYWLDRVEPATPWRPTAVNEFSWPRSSVLDPLGLKPRDLLALVRLGTTEANVHEVVAPVQFGTAAEGPRRIVGYRFVIKARAAATASYRFERRGGPRPNPVGQHSCRGSEQSCRLSLDYDAPIEIRWPAADRPEGWYRFSLEGRTSRRGDPMILQVDFFHAPIWPS